MKKTSKNLKSKTKSRFKFSWKDGLLYGFLILFFLFLLLGIGDMNSGKTTKTQSLSQVVQGVKANKVKTITVEDPTKLTVVYKNGETVESTKEDTSSIYQILNDAHVDPSTVGISVKDNTSFNTWLGILGSALPIIVIMGILYFLFRQMMGTKENIFSFGNNKGKTFNKDFPKVTFADVAGVDEAKQELFEVVDFLRHPEKYRAVGARSPKGVLLVGPSGTGKTLLARAVAGEARVSFISIAGSEFMEMLVGVGAARVRDLFATAKKSQPAIIFIDEVDAIGRQRGVGIMGGHDEREQTLNQILVEMDGFTPNEQLVVIAATNRPDILDPALVRPGRFDRRIVLPLPDMEGRKEILQIHAEGKPFEKDINWERAARRTVGFSGADLENMLNEAAILTARQNEKAITFKDIEEAATKVKLGPEKRRLQSEEDKRITAFHEGGHALVSYYNPHMDPVHRISIVSRGMSLGHTLIPPAQDRVHETKTRLLEQIAVALGGRVAEEVVFSEMTTGAANDFEASTRLARAMVIEYGMSDLGPINYDVDKARMYYETSTVSEEMQGKIDAEINKIVEAAYKKAHDIITKHMSDLEKVADALMEKETLEGEEFIRIIESNNNKKPAKAKKPQVKAD
jgi:cell division protease FtsH